jgi:predicted MFS family arabinose efflux permease
VFVVVAIPGLILAAFMAAVLRDPPHITNKTERPGGHAWSKIFHSRNILVSMFALFCAMCGVFVLSAMTPNYLVDYLHLSTSQMGFVTSALGFGGFIGQFALPGLSDILGRRLVAIAGFLFTALLIRLFISVGPDPSVLFAVLFLISLCCLGLVALLTGPIATESAPVGLVSSAIGIVVGAGEIFGGGVAPSLAGYIAQHYGIQNVLYLALGGVAAGVLVCFFLRETAPRKVPVGLHAAVGKPV